MWQVLPSVGDKRLQGIVLSQSTFHLVYYSDTKLFAVRLVL